MRAVLIIGCGLLAVSGPPLALMARETTIDAAVRRQYLVERVVSPVRGMEGGALRGEIGSRTVELFDDQPFAPDEPFKVNDTRVEGRVGVVVDGQPASTPVAATIRLHSRDANRYWGFVYLMRLVERDGPDRLVVAQNLGRGQYRTISVYADGRIVEDQFGYDERCSPPVRALLIRYVVPHPSGYCSDLMQVWPSLFYPVLYPWLSGAVGLVSVLVAGPVWLRRRVSAQHSD